MKLPYYRPVSNNLPTYVVLLLRSYGTVTYLSQGSYVEDSLDVEIVSKLSSSLSYIASISSLALCNRSMEEVESFTTKGSYIHLVSCTTHRI